MNKDSIYGLLADYHADKKAGVKRGPLHLLKECTEEAGISSAKYGHLVRKHGNAPQPVLITQGKGNTQVPTKHFRKAEVLAYIAACLKAEGESK
jgi:hypothetical protein